MVLSVLLLQLDYPIIHNISCICSQANECACFMPQHCGRLDAVKTVISDDD
ncbi:hypothetical protein MBAV_004861 [Candidatus Magnetobacterium bavaricum]|uniref:Uncharacterized protein n=1 Tax=Candidatus Magnetobacterium bavaricum TaxID=29290 RepID=A0A0F3GM00_9BACT|nr:hypothetical protein MBAV_004861 [Candidatus Magnetobacterium bavaricum]